MKKEEKIQRIIIISIVCVAIIIISLLAYVLNTTGAEENIGSDVGQGSTSDYESASTQIGKTVEESEEEYETAKNISNSTDTNNTTNTITGTTANSTNTTDAVNSTAEGVTNSDGKENEVVEEKKEVTFEVPIKGQIIREFATDSLVYSNTLKEWITHNGVDIQADKTSVVSAAADGTVYAIKNDPRYGLTVIINHDDGYQTIYSNLLTAEFVVQGEEVTQGQSIGTVGNSAAFEISDDYHLHFELLQNNEYLDPTIYMSFE